MEENRMNINTGIIAVDPRPGDFVAGGETGVAVVTNNAVSNWVPYTPAGEFQKLLGVPSVDPEWRYGFETDACVSFSFNDCVETYGDLLKDTWAPELVQWLKDKGYFGADGKLNFSDRFLARMSNTTKNGNSLPNVGDASRSYGLVPESMWPFPVDEIRANPSQAWEIYYKYPPADVLALGKEFRARFLPASEWVVWPGSGATPDKIKELLKVAPIQIATAVCSPWNTDQTINACGAGTAHATLLVNVDTNRYDILDHYDPYIKHFALDYDITYGMRHVLNPVPQPPAATFHHVFSVDIHYGAPAGIEVRALQTALQTLKRVNGIPYMKPGVFGPYGPQTQMAVDAYQRDNHIVDPEPGKNVGPQTRAALNKACK